MQRYKLANNGLSLPNQSAPNWDRVLAAMARPAMSPAEALRCAPGTTVKVRGVVRPGPGGPLSAPISGQQCAWYRSYVQPGDWVLQELPPEGRISDLMLVAQPSRVWWRRYDQTDEISETVFSVVGADGSALNVDPRVADVNSDHVARNRVVSSRFGFLRQLLVEFVLPVGVHVVLLADIGPDGQPDVGKDAFVFVSTRPDEIIVDRATRGRGQHDSAMAMFRFVRGGNRVARAFGLATRIMGLATILIILALVIWVIAATV